MLLFVSILHFLNLLGMLYLSLYGFFFKSFYAVLLIFIPVFKLFQFTTTENRTDLCHECGFRFCLGCFQFLRLDFLPYLVKLLLCLLLLGLQLLYIGFKFTCLSYQITVVLDCFRMPCFRASYISLQTIFFHCNCRGRQRVSHVSAHHRHIGARYWLSCGRGVCLPSASSWLSGALLLLSVRL